LTTLGDLVVAGAGGAPARLPIAGVAGAVLTDVGGAPAWAMPAFADPLTTAGDLLVGGVAGAPGRLPIGAADGQILTRVAGALAWAFPAFTSPLAAAGDLVVGGVAGAPARLPIGAADGNILTRVAGALAWAAPAFANPMTTAGDIMIGGVAGAPTRLAMAGADGMVLARVAGAIAWQAGLTNPMTTAGDIIIGGAAGAPARLGIGAAGQVLTVASGAPAWAPAAGGGGASLFGKTIFQCHFEGANGSNAFTEVAEGRVATPGNATIITADSKFGASCGNFTGAGNQLSYPATADLNLPDVFCIEGFFKTTTAVNSSTLAEMDNAASTYGSWVIGINKTGSDGKVYILNDWNNFGAYVFVSAGAVNDGAWHHIALVGLSGICRFFVDGVLSGVIYSNSWNLQGANSGTLKFGYSAYGSGRPQLTGKLDEWRIVVGDPVYTKSSLVVPTASFPDA
jgi:hypothetical protein